MCLDVCSTQCAYVMVPDRDVMEVAKEIVATITDPQGMVGPEVSILRMSRSFLP